MRSHVNGEVPSATTAPPVTLTATQEGMWIAERLRPGRSGYHDAVTLHLSGPLDAGRLRAAFLDCHQRHDALRLRIHDDGAAPRQSFDAPPPAWHEHDLRGLAGARQTADCRRRFALDCTAPFDLVTGPLWRARLLRLGDREHRLTIVLHHLMTDGWSHGVFLRTLISRYATRLHGAGAPASPASSFRSWVRRRVEAENAPGVAERAREAAAELSGVPRRIALPGLTGATGLRGAVRALDLEPGDLADFNAACAAAGVSRFMAMTSLLALQISRLSGAVELMVAAPVADRLTPEAAQVLGCTINTVPIRFGAAASPKDAVLAGRVSVVRALRLLDVPYRDVIRAAEPSTGMSSADPLTNVSCEEFNSPRGTWKVGPLTVTALPRGEFQTRHDLTLSVPHSAAEAPEMIYPVRRWQPDAIAGITGGLADLVRAFGRPARRPPAV
ncbi:condensation domain-containing protein [Actinoplanes sp. NPDC049265]|uniref:condensation domain-containing protein n=1 Tax=Actinoplanes sp. NPDC049265 TaxID=3363902 RepID=UPI0037156AA3